MWYHWAMIATSLLSTYMQSKNKSRAPGQTSNLSASQQQLEASILSDSLTGGTRLDTSRRSQLIDAMATSQFAQAGRARESLLPQGDPDEIFQTQVQDPFLNLFKEDVLPRFNEERSGAFFSSSTERGRNQLFDRLGDTLLQARGQFDASRLQQRQFAEDFFLRGSGQAAQQLGQNQQTMAGLLASMLGKDAMLNWDRSQQSQGLGDLPLMFALMTKDNPTNPAAGSPAGGSVNFGGAG